MKEQLSLGYISSFIYPHSTNYVYLVVCLCKKISYHVMNFITYNSLLDSLKLSVKLIHFSSKKLTDDLIIENTFFNACKDLIFIYFIIALESRVESSVESRY